MFGFRSRGLGRAAVLSALFIASQAHAEPIQGAGSTFAAPVLQAWAAAYKQARTDGGDFTSPDWNVDYEPVGSLGGVMRLTQPELDFAATDTPFPPEELDKRGLKQFPIVLGAVAVVVNLEGVASGALRLNGSVLADIYMGKVKQWNDPALQQLNPELKLPGSAIEVQHRADGSGTTQAFTEYLAAGSRDWLNRHGANQVISWQTGRSHKGNQGVTQAVSRTQGAIGYVELGQAQRAKLAVASLADGAGNYVRPDTASITAAVTAVSMKADKHFYATVTGQGGAGAYPITAATFAVVPTQGRNAKRIGRVTDLFDLAFDKGDAQASALGYVPLPPALTKEIRAYWAKHLGARG